MPIAKILEIASGKTVSLATKQNKSSVEHKTAIKHNKPSDHKVEQLGEQQHPEPAQPHKYKHKWWVIQENNVYGENESAKEVGGHTESVYRDDGQFEGELEDGQKREGLWSWWLFDEYGTLYESSGNYQVILCNFYSIWKSLKSLQY